MAKPATLTAAREEVAATAASALPAPWGLPIAPAVLAAVPGRRPVLERVPGPRLHELAVPPEPARGRMLGAAGALLRALHESAPPLGEQAALEFPPWRPLPFEQWLGISPAQSAVIGRLHCSVAARPALAALESALTGGSVWCHGDARADNFCVRPGELPVLVDWERSGCGAREADLGSLCGSVLSAAVLRATGSAELRGQAVLAALGGELDGGRASIAAILEGYGWADAAGAAEATLARAVGAHLVCRSLARTAYTDLDRPARFLLEIGLGLVVQPGRWHALTR